MRVQNKDITVQKVLFSKTFSFFYFLIALFFFYKSFNLFFIWYNSYQKNIEIKDEYQKKEIAVKLQEEKQANNKTDLGQERYKKEFFNKLDDGEEMIVLYDGENKVNKENYDEEKERHLFFWEKWYLNFSVWRKNLR